MVEARNSGQAVVAGVVTTHGNIELQQADDGPGPYPPGETGQFDWLRVYILDFGDIKRVLEYIKHDMRVLKPKCVHWMVLLLLLLWQITTEIVPVTYHHNRTGRPPGSRMRTNIRNLAVTTPK